MSRIPRKEVSSFQSSVAAIIPSWMVGRIHSLNKGTKKVQVGRRQGGRDQGGQMDFFVDPALLAPSLSCCHYEALIWEKNR